MSTNETTTITVAGMTCGHCVTSVENEIRKIAGVESVAVDLPSGIVTVDATTSPSAEALEAAVSEAGYEVVS